MCWGLPEPLSETGQSGVTMVVRALANISIPNFCLMAPKTVTLYVRANLARVEVVFFEVSNGTDKVRLDHSVLCGVSLGEYAHRVPVCSFLESLVTLFSTSGI